MKIIIKNNKAREVFFNDQYYPVGVIFDVDFSTAVKLSKVAEVDFFHEKMAYDPELWKARKFNFISDIDMISGWGNVSTNLLKYSNEYDISVVGRLNNITDPTVCRFIKNDLQPQGAMIWHDQPKGDWLSSLYPKNIAIVPFETTRVPASWVPRINSFDALFVPCVQNIQMFRDSGVTVPIELIHWGIDENKFRPVDRAEGRPFTFGTMGALSDRKGTDLLIKAFQLAFPNNEDVRLICKTSYNFYHYMVKDPRIKVQLGAIDHNDLMREFFAQIDCFVFPTRGEGFGLTPLEAMATGVPAIVTGWSGPVEYMNEDVGWLIDYQMTPAKSFTEGIYKEDCGDWAEPSLNHLVELMRYAYEHPEEVKQKGRNAAEHVINNWLWKDKIKMFHEALSKHL